MTIPQSIHVGGKRASEAPQAGRAPSAPPAGPAPLATASRSGSRFAPSADASAAPTSRPPPLPGQLPIAAATSATLASAAKTGTSERRGGGFTSVIRHLSLREWLRWIQSSHSDAVLRVRTPDGGNGTIWCNGGKVVDAVWAKLTPEAALREMLGLASGAVSIDFEPLDRARRSPRLALDLLPLLENGAAAPPSLTPSDPALQHSFTLLPSELPRPRLTLPRLGSVSRSEYLAGGLLLFALSLGAFAFGRLRAASDSDSSLTLETEPAQQTKVGLLPALPAQTEAPAAPAAAPAPRELAVISFAAIEVEPANAEVWLDHSLVGLGRIELAPIPDGVLHELRFVADGHTARSLFFVEAPPAGRVILERIPGTAPALQPLEKSTPDTPAGEGASAPLPEQSAENEREPVKRALRRRAAAPPAPSAQPVQRQRAAGEMTTPAKAPEVRKAAQVQLIEARTPRVQVLE